MSLLMETNIGKVCLIDWEQVLHQSATSVILTGGYSALELEGNGKVVGCHK